MSPAGVAVREDAATFWPDFEAMRVLAHRDDPLALAARARARDGELTYTAAWAWLREQEGETA